MSISYQIGKVGPDSRSIDRAAARLQRILNDYHRTETTLIESIEAEELLTRCNDPSDPRYSMLARSNPEAAHTLLELAQGDVDRRWKVYSNHALSNETPDFTVPEPVATTKPAAQNGDRND